MLVVAPGLTSGSGADQYWDGWGDNARPRYESRLKGAADLSLSWENLIVRQPYSRAKRIIGRFSSDSQPLAIRQLFRSLTNRRAGLV